MEQLSIYGVEPVPDGLARKTKLSTRGEYYGIKAASLARVSRGKLAKMRAKIERLHEPWLEADPILEQVTARVLEAVDALSQQFLDSAEYMNEPME